MSELARSVEGMKRAVSSPAPGRSADRIAVAQEAPATTEEAPAATQVAPDAQAVVEDSEVVTTEESATTEEAPAETQEAPVAQAVVAEQEERQAAAAVPVQTGASRQAEHIFFGLGGTGVQVVEQLLRAEYHARKNGTASLMAEGSYDYIMVDTSRDLDPAAPGYSHTREGNKRWIEFPRLVRLAELSGGASRMPPIAEFVAENTIEQYLGDEGGEFYYQLVNDRIKMIFMVHSASGGSGGALAANLGTWLNAEKMLGKILISFVCLNEVARKDQQPGLVANAMYNFPRLNKATRMVVLVDNQAVKEKIDHPRSEQRLARYMKEIESNILAGCPEYLVDTGDKEYMLVDRYIHRIMSVLTRIPVDIGNIVNAFFGGETYYNADAKWVVPYIYPLDGDYEDEYDQLPPAYLTLRALTEGNLCKVSQNGHPGGSKAVVIFERPDGYRFVSVVKDHASRVVAEVLEINQEDVQVILTRSRRNGVSVTVLWLHPRTNFLDEWCAKTIDQKQMEDLQTEWSTKVRSAGSESLTPENGSLDPGIPDAWVQVYRGIAARLRAVKITESSSSESKEAIEKQLETLETGLPQKVRKKIDESATVEICRIFMDYARKVGLMSNDPRGQTG